MEAGSKKWLALVEDGARILGIDICREKSEKLAVHARALLKWNKKINLTAITDPFQMAVKHFIDSAACLPDIDEGAVLMDMGSGGGFPGIPLKILCPSLSVTLVDSSGKKINFLKHVVRVLGLENINAVHARAEELAKDNRYTECYDIAVSRAFSNIDRFSALALPFLKKDGGAIMAMKGRKNEQTDFFHGTGKEHFKINKKKYTLPFLNSKRYIFIAKFGLN